MIRRPSSLDRLTGARRIVSGTVVIDLDVVRRGQTITCKVFELHARRCIEARELLEGERAMQATTTARPFPNPNPLPPAA